MSSIQDRVHSEISKLDKKLAGFSYANNFERQTGVPKVYVVLGFIGLYVLLVFFNFYADILVKTGGFVFPCYYTWQALVTSDKADDTQLLTYWLVYSFLAVAEGIFNVTYWFPFYYTVKLAAIVWLASPQTQGAQFIFDKVLEPAGHKFFTPGPTSANLKATATGAKMQ